MSFRWNKFAAIGFLAFLYSPGIMAEEFDSGGVSFDFQKISDQRFKVKPVNARDKPGVLEMPLSVCLGPMSFLDNTFCLSQDDPAVMSFIWRKNVPKDKVDLKNPVLNVQLPESVQVKAVRNGLKLISSEEVTVDGKPYRLHKIDISADRARPLTEGYDFYLTHSLLVFTSDAAGAALADGSCWVSDGDKQLTDKGSFHLKVIPSIRLSAKPDIFMNGIDIGGPYLNFPGNENRELVARFIGGTGTAWLIGTFDAATMESYRRNGVKIITPTLYWINDGYLLGDPKKRPEYAKFKYLGETKNTHLINGTCPVAVYTESEYFKKSVIPYLESGLKGADGLWANWEPYMYNGKGCFCDNCRDEFAKYSKLPAEEVKKAWPQEMMIGKKYNEICIKFRSYQQGLVVKVLNKAVDSLTTGKAGFIPGIAWNQMTNNKTGRNSCTEFDPLDYAGALKYVEPWGPYNYWDPQGTYSYTKGVNLRTYLAARLMREFTDKSFPNPKERPKLQAFPHGLQGGGWVTQPEAITMEIISFFLNRFEVSTTYYFPRGYDNRFWAAHAEASRAAAENEKYVFNGSSFDGFSSVPQTPYPAYVKRPLGADFSEVPPSSMLQTAGFKIDGKYLAAVGNFWEKGDVFFSFSAKGLDKDMRYVVSQPEKKRYFAGDKGDSFTGAELEKGVLLHAGAMRWAFFVIEPFREKTDYGRKIIPTDVAAAMNSHLPEITKAADIEKKRDAAEDAANQKSDLREISSGKLSCTPITGAKEEQQLKFKSGDNELLVGLNGMLVKSWKVNASELVSSEDGGKFGLGFPAFWQPSATLAIPYLVKKLEATPSGIMIVAERAITVKDLAKIPGSEPLEFIAVRQKIEVDSDCKSVKFETELLNVSSDETGPRDITVAFRYHNMPMCLGEGTVAMKDNGQEVVFKRKFQRMLFATPQAAASVPQIKKLYEIALPKVKITAPEAVFIPKDGKPSVTMQLAPAAEFAGFASWDQPSMKVPTFEAFFNPVTIKSQKSAKYSMSFEVK